MLSVTISDGRGSRPQRQLYEMLCKIYPIYDIVYEQAIPQLNQRIDLLVKELGIAVEYDGRQHEEYVDFFHKDVGGFISGIRRDRHKEEFCAEHGVKVVRLSGDIADLNLEDLKNIIDEIPYPDTEYDKNCFTVENPRLIRDREYRKEQYQKTKRSISEKNEKKE